MATRTAVVIGAGGFGREVKWLMQEISRATKHGGYDFLGYVVSDVDGLERYTYTAGDVIDKHHITPVKIEIRQADLDLPVTQPVLAGDAVVEIVMRGNRRDPLFRFRVGTDQHRPCTIFL